VVYPQYISAKIHSKCASQTKVAKNSLKTLFWGFKVVQGHALSAVPAGTAVAGKKPGKHQGERW